MREKTEKIFIARDRDGALWVYTVAPIRVKNGMWDTDEGWKMTIDESLFPNLSYNDNFIEIKLKDLFAERGMFYARSN